MVLKQTNEPVAEAGTSLSYLFKCGEELLISYSILAENLSVNSSKGLIFSGETISPQEFCQVLVNYAYSAVEILSTLQKTSNEKNSAILSKLFTDTLQPTVDFVSKFNTKYGNKESFTDCAPQLRQDLNRLGELFLLKRVGFESLLLAISQPEANNRLSI